MNIMQSNTEMVVFNLLKSSHTCEIVQSNEMNTKSVSSQNWMIPQIKINRLFDGGKTLDRVYMKILDFPGYII